MISFMLSSVVVSILATIFVFVCLFMTLLILIQRPKGGGLSGAFGGAGGGSTAVFGAKTGDILTLITVGFFVVFLVLGVALNYTTRADARSEGKAKISEEFIEDPASGGPAGTAPAGAGELPGDTLPGTGTDPLPGLDDTTIPNPAAGDTTTPPADTTTPPADGATPPADTTTPPADSSTPNDGAGN